MTKTAPLFPSAAEVAYNSAGEKKRHSSSGCETTRRVEVERVWNEVGRREAWKGVEKTGAWRGREGIVRLGIGREGRGGEGVDVRYQRKRG